MLTVDIDTGGTMTDALVSDGTVRLAFKVDTTPHDYTISFLACLQEAARAMSFATVEQFLRRVDLIRWSSTITTNVLGERRGSKVGLLVSRGEESCLYGPDRSPIVGALVPENAVIGLPGQPTSAQVLGAVKQLLENGVRRICVCLADAFPDNTSECAIKQAIEAQYPDHIIGAVPVLLGSEMAPVRHDQTRAHYSVMNAYTHAQLANSLFKAEDLLRDEHGWNGPLLIGHTNGGVARIGKTKAVDTIESGPVFGTFGGAFMADLHGFKNVVCFDVGGTTTKASVIRDGNPACQRGGELMGVPVQSSFVMLRSAVVGGGSVAQIRDGVVALGPESMGAAPGPACYGLGGSRPTLTDALHVLGYLDGNNFLGGRRCLQLALAEQAIEQHVARPLGLSVIDAALSIRDGAVAMMATLVADILSEAGLSAADTPLFAFGGNGPMFAVFVAQHLGMPSAHIFDLGPVFSTFGSAISDVVHCYERGIDLAWESSSLPCLLPMIAAVQDQAGRDLRGEGFDPRQASWDWEAELASGTNDVATLRVNTAETDPALILAALDDAVQAAGHGTRHLLGLRLSTRHAVGNHGVLRCQRKTPPQVPGQRDAQFAQGACEPTDIWRWEHMNVGDIVQGPVIINGETMTCPVPKGWCLAVDEYGNACLQRS